MSDITPTPKKKVYPIRLDEVTIVKLQKAAEATGTGIKPSELARKILENWTKANVR